MRQRPGERCAEISLVRCERLEPASLVVPRETGLGLLRQPKVVLRVPSLERLFRAELIELLECELVNRGEHRDALSLTQEALVEERGEQIENVAL